MIQVTGFLREPQHSGLRNTPVVRCRKW